MFELSYSVVSVLHIAAALIALTAGAFVIGLHKGTRVHKIIGYVYVVAMLTLNVSALHIFRLTGTFGPFHVAAIISLVTMLAGFAPALLRRSPRWLDTHLRFMAWSYIGLLAAGASEASVRLPATPFWPAVFASALSMVVAGRYVLMRNRLRLVRQFENVES